VDGGTSIAMNSARSVDVIARTGAGMKSVKDLALGQECSPFYLPLG